MSHFVCRQLLLEVKQGATPRAPEQKEVHTGRLVGTWRILSFYCSYSGSKGSSEDGITGSNRLG